MPKPTVNLKAAAETRAKKALTAAGVRKTDSTTGALRKLERAMSKEFGKDYDTKIKPLGIELSEKIPARLMKREVTGTGTIKCHFPPWSCGPDVDG